jgi:uncharacterized surface protein with fasciclin (FAS1) repeats
MVSIGPNSQSCNMTHMYNISDLHGSLPKEGLHPTSLSGIIKEHPDFKKFSYILDLSGLEGEYNASQANYTLFVPSDKSLSDIHNDIFTNIDDSTARHIVKTSTLKNRISSELLSESPASYFTTKSASNRLFITNTNNKTYINNSINVIYKDMNANNGLIHVIDGLIWPLEI